MAAGPGSFPLDCPTCLVQSDSRASSLRHSEFGILWQALTPPRKSSALPPRDWRGASPKAVSGRTSYLRVRLEFLPYPRLIATLFNGCAYGPPLPFTAASAWTRIGHPVSGLRMPTPALFRLGFPPAPHLQVLNHAGTRSSPDRSTESTRSCPPGHFHSLWTQGFRFSFTPLPGFFSPFPHGTLLYRSPGSIQACGVVPASSAGVSRVPAYSGSRQACFPSAYGAFTLSGRPSQNLPARVPTLIRRSLPRSACTPVWPSPLPLAATQGIDFSFLSSGYLDVSVRRVPLRALWIHARMHGGFPCGFPHSDTCGSQGMCPSPQLFAACRVFHRLLVPGHPPCAFHA